MELKEAHIYIIGGFSLLTISALSYYFIKGKSSIEKGRINVLRGK